MRRSFSHVLLALAGVALVACGSDAEHAGALAGPDASVELAAPPECVDVDGDGYGPSCALGPDCDEADPAITDGCYRCATPDDGCPCSNEGATIACGKIATKTESHVTCTMGQRVCTGGSWSACAPSDVLDTKVLPTKGLGGVSGCVGNPCDPYCKSFPDTPDGTLSNDAGIVGTDSGLTVIPEPIDAGPPVTCADLSLEAEKIPLDMFVMWDKSGSMSGTRWTSARDAMKSYVILPETKGDGMALHYFPDGSSCLYSNYSNFDIKMGTLPGNNSGHATLIRNSLDSNWPSGVTPTRPALGGAHDYARTWQAAHPTRRSVVILVTDGEPNGCSSTVSNVSTIASTAYAASPSIPTYVIGVGGSVSSLNSVALAGSGGKESYIPVASGDTTALINAMRKIRSKAAGCDFTLPTPPSGDISPGGTVVQIKDTSSGTAQTLPQRTSSAACGTSAGFYYDNPSDPKKAFLCPASCTKVGSDIKYKVEIVFKCKATCGKGAFKAEPLPVGMHIMLDKSGSMGGSRWTNVTNALKSFINATSSNGLAVGIDYFPIGSTTSTYCATSTYTTPAVAMSLLPGNRTPLVNSINANSPGGNTPTRPALEGAITVARNYKVANPTHEAVVVLATDGEPTMCTNNNPTYIGDNVAKAMGVDGSPSIKTYVIGVGSGVSAANMDYIASRGGSGSAYMVNDGSSTAFLAAIDDIRKRTLSCDFAIPPTTLGIIDGNTLKLRYVRDDGTVVTVPRVAGASACGTGGTLPGWYADAVLNPTKINLCGGSCTDVKAQDKAELYVFYDCLEGGEGTFTRDYQIDCPVGTRPIWGYWSWNATTPGDSSIDFTVTSGSTIAELGTNPEVALRFSNPPGPASLVGQPIGVKSTPVNTQVGFTFVDTSLALGGLSRNTKFLRVRAHLNGTTVQPTLTKWNQEVSCVPSE